MITIRDDLHVENDNGMVVGTVIGTGAYALEDNDCCIVYRVKVDRCVLNYGVTTLAPKEPESHRDFDNLPTSPKPKAHIQRNIKV